ncbi:MAG TPA: SGNH/GDSL hydrolase family protein [Gemmatimonadaceae bacterium]|nr:SGNH/GDSL hydrolase family protein [Gemmatimonadaceae bacterium]
MRIHRLLLLALTLAACATGSNVASGPSAAASPKWFATWTASASDAPRRPPRDSVDRTPSLYDQTLRLVVRTSIGGDAVRIRLSNEYGDRPLVIDAAHVAVRDSGAGIVPSTDHALTFGGRSYVRLLPGAVAVSDASPFAVPALRDLAVSLHLADTTRLATRHQLGLQTNYVKGGNTVSAQRFTPDTTLDIWPFLVSVDVTNRATTGVIVAIGNSITDGARSTRDANMRWPNILAARLLASGEPLKAVVNAGISGGRVLTYGAGPSALARFDRDVLATPGLTHVILLEGINDIGRSAQDGVTADDIIFGYRQLITRAHDRGVVIFGATLTPAGPRASFTPALEERRAAVNRFVRTSGEFDGVIDFDATTRDPANPLQFLPAYDSGDHLHPGDAGYRAMAESIDLTLFRRRR